MVGKNRLTILSLLMSQQKHQLLPEKTRSKNRNMSEGVDNAGTGFSD